MSQVRIDVPKQRIVDFCQKWQITELAFFGSVLEDAFQPTSDVDIVVNFSRDALWSLLDLVQMQGELKDIFGREVDLVEESGLRNPFRRHAILTTKRVIYATPGT